MGDLDGCPDSATPATIRIALRRLFAIDRNTLDAAVDLVIQSLQNEQDREDAKDLWLYAKTIERTHPLVSAIAQSLNLSQAQITQVFIFAGNI